MVILVTLQKLTTHNINFILVKELIFPVFNYACEILKVLNQIYGGVESIVAPL